MKTARKNVKVTAFLVALIPIGFFSSCAYLSSKGNLAYESTKPGDSRAIVIDKFDMPFVSKASGVPFSHYEAEGCKSPCAERLWFQNKLSFDIEAWSVDFDKQGHAIDKYHWTSP